MSEVAIINGPSAAPAERSSALAIAAEQSAFTREQVAALKAMNGWTETPDAELSMFFHQAKRTGLDPFARQIYLIGRGQGNRKQYTIQTGIDGYRLIADRTGTYAGSDAPEFGEDDLGIWCKKTVWKIVQGVRCPYTALTYRHEYDAGSPIWRKMPNNQHAKCTEASVLRMGWPADLSGIYTSEEMEQADSSGVIDAAPSKTPPAPTQASSKQERPDTRPPGEQTRGSTLPNPSVTPQELRRAWQDLPQDARPDWTGEVWPAYQRDPQAALDRLHELADLKEDDDPRDDVGQAAGEPRWVPEMDEAKPEDEPEGEAAVEGSESESGAPGEPPLDDGQYTYIHDIAEELYSDKSERHTGVQYLERQLGRSLTSLTREEATAQIRSLDNEYREMMADG